MMTTISTARRAGACGPVSVDGTGVFRPVLRRDLMAAVRRTRRHYGLNTGDVLVLDVLLSFLPCRDRTSGQDRPITAETMPVIYAANATICGRANDMDPRVLRRHIARLVSAGFLVRRDSATGKRFALRAGGQVRGAYGLDVSPLLTRHAEISETAARLDEEAEEMRSLRAEALTLRGTLLDRAGALTAEALSFVETAKTVLRRTSLAVRDALAIRDRMRRLLGACEAIEAPCPAPENAPAPEDQDTTATACATDEMTAANGESVRQVESPKIDTKSVAPIRPETILTTWNGCSALHDLRSTPPGTVREFQEFIYDLGPYLGVAHRTLADAIMAIGWTEMLRALNVMVERAATISNPNGYLVSLTRDWLARSGRNRVDCPRATA